MKVATFALVLCLVVVATDAFQFTDYGLVDDTGALDLKANLRPIANNAGFQLQLTAAAAFEAVDTVSIQAKNVMRYNGATTTYVGSPTTPASGTTLTSDFEAWQNTQEISAGGGFESSVIRIIIPQGTFHVTGDATDLNDEFIVYMRYAYSAKAGVTLEASTFDEYAAGDKIDPSLDQFVFTLNQEVDPLAVPASWSFTIEATGETPITFDQADITVAENTISIDTTNTELPAYAADGTTELSYSFTLAGFSDYYGDVMDLSGTAVTGRNVRAEFWPFHCGKDDFQKYDAVGRCDCDGPNEALSTGQQEVTLNLGTTDVNGGNFIVSFDEPLFYRIKDTNTAEVGLRPSVHFTNEDGTVVTTNGDACEALFTWEIVDESYVCTAYDPLNPNMDTRTWVGTANARDFYANCPYFNEEDVTAPTGDVNAPAEWSRTEINVQVDNYTPFRLQQERGPTFVGEVLWRPVTHAFGYYVYYQRSSEISVNAVNVFSNVAAVRAIVKQAVTAKEVSNIDEAEAQFEVFFSVQYPFALDLTGATIGEQASGAIGFGFGSGWSDVSGSDYTCDQGADNSNDDVSSQPCEQLFAFTMTTPAGDDSVCDFDSNLIAEIPVTCVSGYDEDCFVENEVVKVAFTIDSSNHCPEVADTVTLEQTFQTYSNVDDSSRPAQGTTPSSANLKSNFLDGQDVYYVAAVWSDQVGIDSTTFQDVTLTGPATHALVTSGTAATGVTVQNTVSAGTAAGVKHYPYIKFTVNAEDTGTLPLNIARRSSALVTVSGTIGVTYITTFTLGYSEIRPFSTTFNPEGFQTENRAVDATATFASADIGEADAETESDSEGDLLANQTAITGGVGAIGLVAMAVAFLAMRKGKAATNDSKLEQGSSSSNMMLQMSNTNSDHSRTDSVEGDEDSV